MKDFWIVYRIQNGKYQMENGKAELTVNTRIYPDKESAINRAIAEVKREGEEYLVASVSVEVVVKPGEPTVTNID